MPARLLVVERHFPYSGGARTESFVALWPAMGWQVRVLTRDPPSTPFPLDEVMAGIPAGVEIERVTARRPGEGSGLMPPRLRRGLYRLANRPLPGNEWIGPALDASLTDAGAARPNLIYSSSPPESAHEIALHLRDLWGIPWVMDVRDLFTQYRGRFSALTPLHAAWARRLEARWYARCNRLIVNTEHHLERLRERFAIRDGNTIVIPNGFREDDRRHADRPLLPGPISRDRPLRIGYLGVLSKPANAWQATLDGLARVSSLERPILLEIWGRPEPEVTRVAETLGLANSVSFRTPQPHGKAMEEVATCDCLLVTTASTHGHLVPQKLYNYLALERWVAALAPAGSMVARVVEMTGAGEVAEPDAAGAARLLEHMQDRIDAGQMQPPIDRTAIETYSRTVHARRLSEVFHEVLGNG